MSFEEPSELEADFRIIPDNSGTVIITPKGQSVNSFHIDFGDGSDPAENVPVGSNVKHAYVEGSYDVTITGTGLGGDTSTIIRNIVVSFVPPEITEVTIENDPTISRQVNVTVDANYAMHYTVDFGEDSSIEPSSANIGDPISYIYQEPGTYTITIEVFGAAIETTVYTEEFEVTSIDTPLVSAPTPPFRQPEDVISYFTTTYENLPADFFPDWGQGDCCGSGWNTFDLDGDEMLQYTNMSHQGNQFQEPVDLSSMSFVHFDFWTTDILQSVEVSLISLSNDERPIVVELTPNEWTSVDIPITEFTDQDGFTVNDIHQIKYVATPSSAGGTLFVDNIYFWKEPSQAPSIAGTWRISPTAGSLRVGPSPGSGDWWAIDDASVAARECFYDDDYIFKADGTFENILGSETWLEGWQGVSSDMCGAPVAPHDGSNVASYSYDDANGQITLTGVGAYLGIPKANNQGELPNVAVPNSITYDVTLVDANNMTVIVEAGSGVFWTFEMVKVAEAGTPLDGSWSITPAAGSLRVGPSPESGDWWAIDDAGVSQRACFYDDEYIFNSDGTFQNFLGSDTWLEGWQGVSTDTCGTPAPPHDGSNAATFSYDATAGTVTLVGEGAYLGIPKANNQGELPNVAVPNSITYNVTFVDDSNIVVVIEAGSGVFWTFDMTKN